MSDQQPRHHRPTRWLIVTPLAGLAVVVAGVVALEGIAPHADPEDVAQMRIEGIPPLAMEEERSCTREDEETVDEIRGELHTDARVSSSQVHQCPAAFDGQPVVYVGEVVGDVLQRRDGAWAWVNDDAYALEVGPLVGHRARDGFNTGLAVWLPGDLHERLHGVGRPGQRGDVILVHGTLLRADPDDGGGITVRADELEIIDSVTEVDVPFHGVQALVALVLALAAVGTTLWALRVRRR